MEFEGRSRIQDELSMAPLIDVVFLLLLFFMLTSTFAQPEAIELSLPTSTTASSIEDPDLRVAIGKGGELSFNGTAIELVALEAAVTEALAGNPKRRVALKADAGVDVQSLFGVVDRIRRGGGTNLAFMTEPGPEPLPSAENELP